MGKPSEEEVWGEKYFGGSRGEELTQNFGICGWRPRLEARRQERRPWDGWAAKPGESLKYLQYRSRRELPFARGTFK